MKIFVLLVAIFLGSLAAQAYPEMIRHGYVNCMACHTTRQGGDLLSPYGKELGKELFSRNDSIFKTEKSEKNYWEIKTPEWLNVGASARLLQTFSESSVASKGRFMIMQVDIDALAQINDNLSFYGAVGRYESSKPDAEWNDFIYTPRLWLQYSQNWRDGAEGGTIRAGRFYPSYGITLVEHSFATRRYLDFNPGQERLSVEAAWSNENYQVTATSIFERANADKYDPERGYALQVSKVFGTMARAGVNIYRTTLTQNSVDQDKAFEGVFALIGWTSEISTLFQADRIHYTDGKTGFVDLVKFGYEYTQGVQLFLTQEYYNADTEKTDPHMEAYGAGVQYFPFPNFDLFATYRKQKDSAQLAEFQDVIWLIAHIYL